MTIGRPAIDERTVELALEMACRELAGFREWLSWAPPVRKPPDELQVRDIVGEFLEKAAGFEGNT